MRWQKDVAFHKFKARFDGYYTEIEELGKAYDYSFTYLTFSSMPQEFTPTVQAYFDKHGMTTTFNILELWARITPIGRKYDSQNSRPRTATKSPLGCHGSDSTKKEEV